METILAEEFSSSFCGPEADYVFLNDATWFEATAAELAAMIEAIELFKEIIKLENKPTDYNIGINSGCDAGQTLPHLHLIPHRRGDVEDPRGGMRNILPAKARWWDQE